MTFTLIKAGRLSEIPIARRAKRPVCDQSRTHQRCSGLV